MNSAVIKYSSIVLIVCWLSVNDGKAVGHVVPHNPRLLLKTNRTHVVLYKDKNFGKSWVQRMYTFPPNAANNYRIRVDNSGVSIKVNGSPIESSFPSTDIKTSTANCSVLNISQLTTAEATTQLTTIATTTTTPTTSPTTKTTSSPTTSPTTTSTTTTTTTTTTPATTTSTTIMTTTASVVLKCNTNFTLLGNQCYYFSSNTAAWLDALDTCKNLSSEFAHPNSSKANSVLKAYLNDAHHERADWWLGGVDEDDDDIWVWTHDESEVNFCDDWWSGQPNETIDDYVENVESGDYMWNGGSCDEQHKFICQHTPL